MQLKFTVWQVRLLVDRSQVGAVLGKGGSIITEMREKTGAAIRVLDKTERPPCAREDDELIQVRITNCCQQLVKLCLVDLVQAYKRGNHTSH